MDIVGGATLERPSVKIRSQNLLRWAFCEIESLKNLWPYGSTFTWLKQEMISVTWSIKIQG